MNHYSLIVPPIPSMVSHLVGWELFESKDDVTFIYSAVPGILWVLVLVC